MLATARQCRVIHMAMRLKQRNGTARGRGVVAWATAMAALVVLAAWGWSRSARAENDVAVGGGAASETRGTFFPSRGLSAGSQEPGARRLRTEAEWGSGSAGGSGKPTQQHLFVSVDRRLVRVGLSTRGGPVGFFSRVPLTVADEGQPGRLLTAPAGEEVRVFWVPTSPSGRASATGQIAVLAGKAVELGWKKVVVTPVEPPPASETRVLPPVRVRTDGGPARWGQPYRGRFELFAQRAGDPHHRLGQLALVNVLPLEQYLRAVVPWEMSSDAPVAALQAQAICARTKTLQLTASGHFRRGGFDVCDYDACQGYPGSANEKPTTTAAVEATEGQVIEYGGRPIDAVYSTNSGGITAAASDVWPHAVPYLQSVVDVAPGTSVARAGVLAG